MAGDRSVNGEPRNPVAPPEAPAGPPKGRTRQLLEGTSWQLASQVIPLIANLALTPYIIMGLGQERWGVLIGVNVLTTVLSQLDGGIGQVAMRYFTIYVGQGDKSSATRLLLNLLGMISIFAVLVFAFVYVFSDQVFYFDASAELVPEGIFLLRTLTLIVAVAMVRQLFVSLLFAHHIFWLNTIAFVMGHAIYLTGVILSIHNGWGLYGVAWTFVAQQVFSTVVIVPQALRRMSFGELSLLTRGELREFWSYAWKIQVAGLMNFMMMSKDTLAVGKLEPATVVGHYGQGSQFAQNLRMIPMQALSPIQGILGRAVGAKGAENSIEDFETIQRYWIIGATGWCAVGIPAAFFGVEAWLPAGFEVAASVAAILTLGTFFFLVPMVLKMWCLLLGKPEVDLRYGLIAFSVNMVFTVLFVVVFGTIGVVYGTLVAYFVGMLWALRDAFRVLPFPVRNPVAEIPVFSALMAAGITFAIEYSIRHVIPDGAIALVICGLAAVPGVLVFALISLGPRRVVGMVRSRLRR